MADPIQLLYVEDDAVERRAFERALHETGTQPRCQLTTADSLAAARTLLAAQRFDVVIADYHLPDGYGPELIGPRDNCPFILITGSLSEQLAVRTIEGGADDYLIKDTEGDYLRVVPATIKKALIRQRLKERARVAEEELRQLNAELEKRVAERMCELVTLTREQAQIAYSITHNLRTPLRNIHAQVSFLRALGAALPAGAAAHLDSITTSAKTLGSQIDALVRFSGLYRQEIRKEWTNSITVVMAALAEVVGKLNGRMVELPPVPLPPCHANPELLQELFRSLLSNACKFTRHLEKPQVEVGGRSELAAGGGRQTLFWVKDNGIGFDMRFHDKIFDLFQRLNWAGDYEGNGCGLALAKRIVECHGGRIWAEGELGKGASFYFSLPEENPAPEKQP